jgi:uncharacterized protein (TIGR02646 family)
MRRIAKGEAPQNVAPDGAPPLRWVDAQKELIETLKRRDSNDHGVIARDKFDDLNKHIIRHALHHDQQNLCIFCERVLTRHGENSRTLLLEKIRIAHWIPINIDPHRAIDWTNVYASCDTKWSCDIKQGKQSLLEDSPGKLSRWLTFNRLGEIWVSPNSPRELEQKKNDIQRIIGDPRKDEDKESVLNLNDSMLKKARSGALKGLMKEMEQKLPRNASTEEREQQALKLLALDPLPPFISIQVAWLRRMSEDAPPPTWFPQRKTH